MYQEWSIKRNGFEIDMEKVAPEELALSLDKFYVEVRPKPSNTADQDLYHRNSFLSIRAGINRFLSDIHRNIDIARDKEFKTANGVIDGMLKERTKTGLSKTTKHKEVIN